jgi:hypothetical protein
VLLASGFVDEKVDVVVESGWDVMSVLVLVVALVQAGPSGRSILVEVAVAE